MRCVGLYPKFYVDRKELIKENTKEYMVVLCPCVCSCLVHLERGTHGEDRFARQTAAQAIIAIAPLSVCVVLADMGKAKKAQSPAKATQGEDILSALNKSACVVVFVYV